MVIIIITKIGYYCKVENIEAEVHSFEANGDVMRKDPGYIHSYSYLFYVTTDSRIIIRPKNAR